MVGAPRGRLSFDRASQEISQRLRVHGAVLRIEHALFVGAQLAAVDAGVREEPGVVIGIHGDAVAHAELSVAEADGGLEARDARLRIQEEQADFADRPGRPALRPAAEVDLAVRQRARAGQPELPEGVALGFAPRKRSITRTVTSVYGMPFAVNPSVTFSTRPATIVSELSMRSTMFIGRTVVACADMRCKSRQAAPRSALAIGCSS